jgi:hypothetical protein
MIMSMEENDAAAQLKRAFEFYLKGEVPSPLELARAPRLENWRAVILQLAREGDALRPVLVLSGRVAGHPELGDARAIRTSQLVWLDRHRQWARTWNRVYRLGRPAGDATDTEDEGVEVKP